MTAPYLGEIGPWYNDRSVFVTGASGFMGKVLLEKLLYGCPDIRNIYILLRGKRGKNAEERIEEMWKLPMFERLRNEYPNAMKKVVPIYGDLISPELGIDDQQRAILLKEVSVVFHLAATLKLEGTLKDAVDMNVTGTLKVLELCKQMKNLTVVIHLSTAFCNVDVKKMEEKVYPFRDNPHDLMDLVRWMHPQALIKATPDLIAPHPNTYIYTKRLAELLVQEYFPSLPIVITRPSIVSPAALEPVAGWVDSLNGPIGLMVGAGKGVIRSMICRGDYPAHTVPVDLAINALIAIGWETGSMYEKQIKPKELPVYNLSQDGVLKVTFGDILNTGRQTITDYPFEWCIWYPGGDMRSSEIIHKFYIIFFHFLPAYFLDVLLLIFIQKRFMVRVQWKITEGLNLLQFFTTNYWDFDCTNLYNLWDRMCPEDKRKFNIDFKCMDIKTYMKVSILGARQYTLKENLASLPRCRLNLKFLYVLDKAVTFAFYYYLLRLVGYFIPSVSILTDSIITYTQSFINKFI